MTKKNNFIPNPNKISGGELDFLKNSSSNFFSENSASIVDAYKGRMNSMSDSFYQELNNYLALNPTEGNRSAFIVRVIAEYLKSKK